MAGRHTEINQETFDVDKKTKKELSAAKAKSKEDKVESTVAFAGKNFIYDRVGKIEEFYSIEKQIGQGTYGDVFLGISKQSEKTRAVKKILKPEDEEGLRCVKLEVKLMKLLDHPTVLKIFESFEDARYLWVILEVCKGGTLYDRIISDPKFSEEWQAANLMKQAIAAVCYLHKKGVCHRQIEPQNFLVMANSVPIGEAQVKLFDFGNACVAKPGSTLRGKSGSPMYMSPQMIQGVYTEKCDDWALGIMMCVMITGGSPFKGKNHREVFAAVQNDELAMGKDWKGVSAPCKELVEKFLVKSEVKRLTAQEALQHEWVVSSRLASGTLNKDLVNNLKAFREMNTLKKAALHVMAMTFDDEAIKSLQDVFHTLDKNGDGTLTMAEIEDGMNKVTDVDEDVKQNLRALVMELDTDGSGKVDYTEFIAATADERLYMNEDNMWAAFKKFDRIGNGVITREELRQVLEKGGIDMHEATEKDLDAIMEEADTNKDQVIDFNEFKVLMRNRKGIKA